MDAFLQDLQAIFPEIEAIDTLPYPDATQAPISLKVKGGRFLPLFTFGDGLQRWYYILGALLLYKKGIFALMRLMLLYTLLRKQDSVETLLPMQENTMPNYL